MDVVVRPASELTDRDFEGWAERQGSNPDLRSPYFRPEFTHVIAAARPDALVAIVNDGEAFLPFHRASLGVGQPIGTVICDYHGLIAAPGYLWDPVKLLKKAGLSALDFDHAPATQTALQPWVRGRGRSPRIELGAFATSPIERDANEKRRMRKIIREIGPVEFEADSDDEDALRQCIAWKSAQYDRSNLRNVMKLPWVQQVIADLSQRRVPVFRGQLSVLRAGGRIVAAHFGIRSHGLLHYWCNSYDTALSEYGPGFLLLLALCDSAAEQGLLAIDFGKGDAPYKTRFANAETPLIEGMVAADPVRAGLRDARRAVGGLLKQTALGRRVHAIRHAISGR